MHNFITHEGIHEITSLSSVLDTNFLSAILFCCFLALAFHIINKFSIGSHDAKIIRVFAKTEKISTRQFFERAFTEALNRYGQLPETGTREEIIRAALIDYYWARIPLYSRRYVTPKWVKELIQRISVVDGAQLERDFAEEAKLRKKGRL